VELAPTDAPAFHKAITQAKAALGSNGHAVYVYSPEEYGHMRLFLTEGPSTGCATRASTPPRFRIGIVDGHDR
jgi:hypothetical protein